MTGMKGWWDVFMSSGQGWAHSLSVQRYSLLPAGQVRHTHLTFLTTGTEQITKCKNNW